MEQYMLNYGATEFTDFDVVEPMEFARALTREKVMKSEAPPVLLTVKLDAKRDAQAHAAWAAEFADSSDLKAERDQSPPFQPTMSGETPTFALSAGGLQRLGPLTQLWVRHGVWFLDKDGDIRFGNYGMVAPVFLTDDGRYASEYNVDDYRTRQHFALSREAGIRIVLSAACGSREIEESEVVCDVALAPCEVGDLVERVRKSGPLSVSRPGFLRIARKDRHRAATVTLRLVMWSGEVYVEAVETEIAASDAAYVVECIQNWRAQLGPGRPEPPRWPGFV